MEAEEFLKIQPHDHDRAAHDSLNRILSGRKESAGAAVSPEELAAEIAELHLLLATIRRTPVHYFRLLCRAQLAGLGDYSKGELSAIIEEVPAQVARLREEPVFQLMMSGVVIDWAETLRQHIIRAFVNARQWAAGARNTERPRDLWELWRPRPLKPRTPIQAIPYPAP